MRSRDFGVVVRGVQTLLNAGTTTALSDSQLLERFLLRSGDPADAAFSALVERHGPMVLRVCRGVLHDSHAAEDAFQAAFLILARKASSIRKRDSVASWLFGVARRVALRAKVQRIRRLAHELRAVAMTEDHAPPLDHTPELLPEIQEEIDRLPERYRAPIVLCYLQGLTYEEAAGVLRLPPSTLRVRLSRARDRLRGRLVRRGLAPIVLAATWTGRARAAIPTPLVNATIKAAIPIAAGRAAQVSASVAALVEGVLRTMFLAKLKTASGLVASLLLGSILMIASMARPVRSDPVLAISTGPAPARGADTLQSKAPTTPEVTIETLEKSRMRRSTTQPATVRAFETADVFVPVSGYLTSLKVDIGSRVKKGELLAEVQGAGLQTAIEKSRALVEKAVVRVDRAQAALEVAEAALAAEHTKVEVAGSAVGDAGAGERALNAARARTHLAQAAEAEARAKIKVARADLSEAKIDVRIAQADLSKDEDLVDSTKIRAPFHGVVILRNYHRGAFVRSTAQGNDAPLLRIVYTDVMRTIVPIPDRDVPFCGVGDPAIIRFDALPGRLFRGTVSRIAESEDVQDRTMRIEVNLPNPEHLLRDGMFGRAEITLEERDHVLTIPSTAILNKLGHQEATCYRVVNGHAVLTRFKIASVNGLRAEVVEGLKEGEAVIDNPSGAISDGQAIAVKKPTEARKN